MQSSDPAFQALFDLWRPATADHKWRVRFKDGAIVVFTAMLAHEDEAGLRNGLGTVVRQIRASADRTWDEKAETFFSMTDIKDVMHQDTGDIVFPASIARKRPAFVRRVSSAVINGNYATKGQAAAGAAVFIGLICLAFGVNDAIKWSARDGEAVAVVEVVRTREVWGTAGRGSSSRFQGYAPDVVYRFTVGGTSYVGNVMEHHADPAPTKAEALRNIPFRRGDTIKAYYHPKNPNNSVVMPASLPPLWIMLMGAPFCFFAAYVAVLSERGARSS